MEKKQGEIASLLRKKLLPLLRERLGYDGSVAIATGPEADAPFVRTVAVAVWQSGGAPGRITMPIDVTRIVCLDKPIVRTVDGVIYLSASDADMAESKVVALFARQSVAERDMVDVFLFQDRFLADSAGRARRKLGAVRLTEEAVAAALKKFAADRALHVRNINAIIAGQLDPQAAANIRKAGGAAMVFDQVMSILEDRLGLPAGR